MFSSLQMNNYRKGGDILLKVLEGLPSECKAETVLLTLGKGNEMFSASTGMESLNLGYVEDDALKAVAYSASDLFLFPTRADNNPLVALESTACGTPWSKA